MSDVKDLLLTVSAIAPVARAVIAATLILGIAGLVATLAWRASASTRHAIWLLALTAAVVAAVVPATGANFVVETESIVNGPGVVPFNREVFPPARMTPHEFSMASVPAAPAPTVTDFVLDNANALAIALWLIGVLTIVVRCVAGHIGIARLVARARPMVRDHEWLIDRAARQTGANGRCVVRLSDDIDVPFTIGARKPVVLLPASATTWSNERLRIVLVHELAHVARFDYVAQLVATAACAIYWFNPIVWLAAARLRTEAEQAADDRVLAAGIDGVTYASHLLELARPDGTGPLSTAVAVGMARGNRLERRFQAMLDSTRSRGTVPLRLQAAAGTAVMLMAVPLVGFRMIPVNKTTPSTVTTASISSRTAAIATPPTTPTRNAERTRATSAAKTVVATQASSTTADTIIEKTLSATPGERVSLDLRNTGGSITVRAWDQAQVRVRATLSGDQARETAVDIQRVSGGIDVRAIVGYRTGNTRNSNRFELWVPRRFDIAISSAGGGIDISGVQGRFTGNTGGGEILMDNVQGEASLTTGGGEVHVSNSNLDGRISTGGGEATVVGVTGNVRVTSGSGPVVRAGQSTRSISVGGNDITVSGGQTANVIGGKAYSGNFSMSRAGGNIDLENVPDGATITTGGGEIRIGSSAGNLGVTTGGGDITVGRMGGNVEATTGAGDVQITVVNTDGTSHDVVVHSGSGIVTIDLPANVDARFDLETAYTERHGPTTIKSEFPVQITETQEWDSRNGTPRRYVRASGNAGAGRGLIKIRTVNGDVIIRRR